MSATPPIVINNLADFKRALAQPGVLVFVDRNDIRAADLARSPATMASAMVPRTVKQVRSKDVILLHHGRNSYLTLPQSRNFKPHNNNVVDIHFTKDVASRDNAEDTAARVLTYRLEMPGTPGAAVPSALSTNHPALADKIIAAEIAARERQDDLRAASIQAHRDACLEIKSLPILPDDPQWPALKTAITTAIAAGLDANITYNAALNDYVAAALGDTDYTTFVQLSDYHADPAAIANNYSASHQYAERFLASHPRGTWQIFRPTPEVAAALSARRHPSEPYLGQVWVSCGHDAELYNRPASEGAIDTDKIRSLMLDHDIYRLRQDIEKRRDDDANAVFYRDIAPVAGDVYKNIWLGGAKYSTVTVTDPGTPETLLITISCRKRGSPSTWEAKIRGAALRRLAETPKHANGRPMSALLQALQQAA